MPIKLRYTLHSMSRFTSTTLLNSLVVNPDLPGFIHDTSPAFGGLCSVILFRPLLPSASPTGGTVSSNHFLFHISFSYLLFISEELPYNCKFSNKLSLCACYSPPLGELEGAVKTTGASVNSFNPNGSTAFTNSLCLL